MVKGKRATIGRSRLEADINRWWTSERHVKDVGNVEYKIKATRNVYKLGRPQISLSLPFSLRFPADPASCSSSASSWCWLPGAGACDPEFEAARFLPLRTTISFSHAFSRRRSLASRSRSSVFPDKSATVRSRLSVLSFFLILNRAASS